MTQLRRTILKLLKNSKGVLALVSNYLNKLYKLKNKQKVMVKKIWQDENYQLEIGYSEKSEKQKESMISLLIDEQEDWQNFAMIQLNKTDVYELIEELKEWLDILEKDTV